MLTGVQLGPVSYLLFISVFGGWHHFLVRLVNKFLKVRWKQDCFQNYILDNTLDNSTPAGHKDFDENNDDNNNNNHNSSDDNNDDK